MIYYWNTNSSKSQIIIGFLFLHLSKNPLQSEPYESRYTSPPPGGQKYKTEASVWEKGYSMDSCHDVFISQGTQYKTQIHGLLPLSLMSNEGNIQEQNSRLQQEANNFMVSFCMICCDHLLMLNTCTHLYNLNKREW